MKKYNGVILKTQMYEYKKGIEYAKPETKLYKWLRALNTVVFAYTSFLNLLFVLGMLLHIEAGTLTMKDVGKNIYTVGIATIMALIGIIFMYCKLYITAEILCIVSLPATIFIYAPLMVESMYPLEGWFGYKESFYWKHFLPVVFVVMLSVWMLVIVIRSKVLFDRNYKKVCDDLFEVYKSKLGEDEVVTEEGWQNFLENYNPDDYKQKNKKKNKKSKNDKADKEEKAEKTEKSKKVEKAGSKTTDEE